ncbi:GSCFA domain-containing protein [Microbulbifer mangrovi]|uniref:GSCFA domain-containing protein n=1 Tax=Microbulbifer mangrovi TaxID=927787 RepID=UPI000990878F|nr:GSCFA domain-containing protein [Microbulbifer mangrovi]
MNNKILVLGNCQATSMSTCLRLMLPDKKVYHLNSFVSDFGSFKERVDGCDLVVSQKNLSEPQVQYLNSEKKKIFFYPRIAFPALHPDCVKVLDDGSSLPSPLAGMHSSIVFWGWKNRFSEMETRSLFNSGVFKTLGFFDKYPTSKRALLSEGESVGVDLAPFIEGWLKQGNFLHTFNHPKLFVMADLARELCQRAGLVTKVSFPENMLSDPSLSGPVWPVYPEIADSYGFTGGREFKRADKDARGASPEVLTLEEFIAECYEIYDVADFPSCAALDRVEFKNLVDSPDFKRSFGSLNEVEDKTKKHPYIGLPDTNFWSRSVARVPEGELDPIVNTKFSLLKSDRLVTAGSCFAQHIAKRLHSSGYNYYVSEQAPSDLNEKEATERNYSVFSARYGNIYSARQLKQLLERAWGKAPEISAWSNSNGSIVDPFRPTIEPSGFSTVSEMEASRATHLSCVRNMIETADVFVFTLGLTEAWVHEPTGCVVPLAPGVSGVPTVKESFVFKNFNLDEIVEDLKKTVDFILEKNPSIKILLTVSPVPLAATYEEEHVLTATTYSKSVLRVAANTIRDLYSCVDYFPSFEIITSAASRGRYYEEDLRTVTPDGVSHVMKMFFRHYCVQPISADVSEEDDVFNIVCDEELLSE